MMRQSAGAENRSTPEGRAAGGAERRMRDGAALHAAQIAEMGKARAKTRGAVVRCLEEIGTEEGRAGSALRKLQLKSARTALTEALTRAGSRHEYFGNLARAAEVLGKGNYRVLGAGIQSIIDAHERAPAPQDIR